MKKFFVILGILSFGLFTFFSDFCFADSPKLILFYGKTCPHCKAEEWYLETLKDTYDFEIQGYEVYYDKANQQKMQEMGEAFWTVFNGVPVVIMWGEYFMGANYDKTVDLLEKYAIKKGDNSECIPETDKVTPNLNPIVDCWEDQTVTLFWKEISLKGVGPIVFGIVLGFADGINPCMFGVLIFLLTYLVSIGSKKKVLYSWLIFAITTFFLYSALMYGMHKLLFSTQVFLPYIATIKYVIGGLAILLWLLELKDFFWYGKWVSLAIPKWVKPILEYITKKGTYMSAFILAVLSTFVELPCTIGIPLAYVGAVGTEVNIFAALGIYNFFFILPLLGIIFGIYYGISAFKTKDGELAINQIGNKKIMRLVAWLILLTLWFLFLTQVL